MANEADVLKMPDRTLTVHQAVARVMQRMKAVGKEGTAPKAMGGYAFRRIEDVMNSLHDVMADEGVIIAPTVKSVSRERLETERQDGSKYYSTSVQLEVEFAVYGPQGDVIRGGSALGEGLDSGDKASNKAHTSALKNFVLEFFMIPTRDGMKDTEADDTGTQRDTKPDNVRAIKPAAPDRNACASSEPPAGEPPQNTAAFDKLQARAFAGATVDALDVGSKASIDEKRNAVGLLILAYLADADKRDGVAPDEKERLASASKMLSVILPGKTGTKQLTEDDCGRVRLAVVMLPRVPGGTVAACQEFMEKQWGMPGAKFANLTPAEVTACYDRLAKPMTMDPIIDPDSVPF